jgi:flagellar hook-basal body complex protein FliE
MVAPLLAAKAYAAVQNTLGTEAGPAAAGGSDFGKLVSSAIGDAIGASRQAEAQMAAQVQGKASLVDVVTAISSAETSLQTVMAIRDQVIAAYQQIMQMPI